MKTMLLISAAVLGLATIPARGDGGLVCHIDVLDPTTSRPSLNMRIAPDRDSPIIGDLENGEHVLVVSRRGRWVFVISPRLGRGWMAAETAGGRPYIDQCFQWNGKDPL